MAHPFRHDGRVTDETTARPSCLKTRTGPKSAKSGLSVRTTRLRVDGRLLEVTIRELGPSYLLAEARAAIEAI